jgi:hypothetical protein
MATTSSWLWLLERAQEEKPEKELRSTGEPAGWLG